MVKYTEERFLTMVDENERLKKANTELEKTIRTERTKFKMPAPQNGSTRQRLDVLDDVPQSLREELRRPAP